MKRCIVNVATGEHYRKGQERLCNAGTPDAPVICWTDRMPPGSPSHQDMPYAFKAYALQAVRTAGRELVLWADASIIPVASLEPLWERIERDGYWISKNGYTNHQWTCKEAYPLLCVTEEENKGIEHVVATAFGLNFKSDIGNQVLDEYLRLAGNGSFRGPWTGGVGVQHRHDQSALSVIAHRLGMKLTDPPEIFSYPPASPGTILLADGAY